MKSRKLITFGGILCMTILLVVLSSGCIYDSAIDSNKKYHTYELQDGTIVECNTIYGTASRRHTLKDCKDGNTYYAQSNFKRLSD